MNNFYWENDEMLDEMINSLDEEPEDDRWCDGYYGVTDDDGDWDDDFEDWDDEDEDDDWYGDWDYNEDEGYDPYEGYYTWDC